MITRLRRVVPKPLAPNRTTKTSSSSSSPGRILSGLFNPPTRPSIAMGESLGGVKPITDKVQDADGVVDAQLGFGGGPSKNQLGF